MISQKGKRKITYKDKLYYWYVKKDEDDNQSYLHIISDDKKMLIIYRVNQINDNLLRPKVNVVRNNKLVNGLYHFVPTLSDESISAHNVRAILSWYENQDESCQPLEWTIPTNPFENIDFKNGVVKHIETDFSRESLREDMLQVAYDNDYLLDVGWYGSHNGFIIHIIKNQDWEKPLLKTHKSIQNLQEAVIGAVEFIEKLKNMNSKTIKNSKLK